MHYHERHYREEERTDVSLRGAEIGVTNLFDLQKQEPAVKYAAGSFSFLNYPRSSRKTRRKRVSRDCSLTNFSSKKVLALNKADLNLRVFSCS
jgi:hypothetical protein